jgi:hypothetical protein
MSDVGFGQLASTTGEYRTKIFRDAISDSHPVYQAMDDNGGINRIGGGSFILDEAISGANANANWVGEAGPVGLGDTKVADAAKSEWRYMLTSVSWTLAEKLKNSGGAMTQYADIIGIKYQAAEKTMMNLLHEGILSSGTSYSGQQLVGLASLVSTTPTSGTVATIDRSASAAAWYRNQKFETSVDWLDGTVDAGNVKRFLDKGINATSTNGKTQVQIGLMGQTHFEALTSAIQAIQIIQNESGKAKAGFQSLEYRGIPMYLSGGVTYSNYSQQTATRTYLLNCEKGGVNLTFHKDAEFEMLEPVNSADQAAVSRLIFAMMCMHIGAYAKQCWVGFD